MKKSSFGILVRSFVELWNFNLLSAFINAIYVIHSFLLKPILSSVPTQIINLGFLRAQKQELNPSSRLFFNLVLSLFCVLWSLAGHAQQVSGTVFRDFNANGIKDNTSTFNEVGISGVTVAATDPGGVALTVSYTGGGASTNITGGYTVTGGTFGQIRLVFNLPNNYIFASNGTSGGTTVLFPSSGTQDLAVNSPSDFIQPNPILIVPCYSSGTLTGGGATNPALVKFGYTGPGYDKYIGQAGYVAPNEITEHQYIGSVWGVAYARTTKKVYAGSLFRRHVVLGPQGVGGIYQVDPTSGTVVNWLNIETLGGIDAGMDTRDGTPANSIPADPGTKSYDVNAFPLAGKNALGDVEISDDESTLFVVNLFQQSLVAINVKTKALIGSYPITPQSLGLTCPQSDLRPWGLKYHNGKIYIGVVCTAESTQNVNNLKGYVVEFDPANPGAGFTNFFSFPFNYAREETDYYWNPWNLNSYYPGHNNEPQRNPQPILSDIEFDVDGSMILGIQDRHGLMFASFNYPPDPNANDPNRANPETVGDILRVCNTSSGLALEGNSGCSYNFTYSNGTIGEYYFDRRQGGDGNGNMKEIAQGALALLPGFNEVVSTTVDEYDSQENGVGWWDNTTGDRNRAYMVYDKSVSGTLGKASGLGDIELLIDPAPIEIGNRIWKDTDKDGVQDAGEMGIDGVELELYEGTTASGSPVQTVTSATLAGQPGTWYFTNLKPNTDYTIKQKTALGTGVLTNCNAYSPTGVGSTLLDNNTSTGTITLTTGNAGENDHTYDIGLIQQSCPTNPAGMDGSTSVCDNSVAGIDLFSLITGEQAGGTWTRTTGTGGTFNAGAGTFTPAAGATSSTFTYTITGASSCPDDQAIATVSITPQANAGADGSTSVCETSIATIDLFSLITGEQAGGIWTRATGTGGTFNAGAGTFTPAAGATSSTFTYTVTGTSPCPNDQAIATVTITPQANAGADGSTSVCDNSVASIDLFSLITGEQAGGTWTRTTGTGGTFNAGAGTFTPAAGATSSTFTYTVTGTSPCPDDQAIATVTITPQPQVSAIPGSVCNGSSIDLSTLVTATPLGTLTFHNTQSDADNNINALGSTVVSPSTSKTYYVRNTVLGACYATAPIVINVGQGITNPSGPQSFCYGSAGSNITVQTDANGSGSIRFVLFTSDQMAGSTPTAFEAASIYGSGNTLASVTPTGASAPYTAILPAATANWSSLAAGTYYLYAVVNPDPGAGCRSVQEIIVKIIELPAITTIPANICVGSTINLATLVIGNTPAGALSFYTSAVAANSGSNPLANTTVAPTTTTTYYVRSQATSVCYSVASITVNVNTAPDFSVTNGSVCQGGSINLTTLVTNTSGGTLSYYTSLAAAQNGAPTMASTTVSPISATNYFVRSTNSSGCFTIKQLTVSILPLACATIQITGPTNN